MSFRSIVQDLRDGLGSLSKRSFDFRLHKGKSQGSCEYSSSRDLLSPLIVQTSRWANLPPELLLDVIKRLEESESNWPARKHVVACASVCRSWRAMCQEIVSCPEICGKLTFPVSLKQVPSLTTTCKCDVVKFQATDERSFFFQPGPRDTMIQCFIKRDKSKLMFHLFLCLSPVVENGKFLLSAKRTRRTTRTEYIISMDADNISRSSNSYLGKLRSNFLGTKFLVYDTQPPQNTPSSSSALITDQTSRSMFHSKRVSPKLPSGSYNIAQITYELNVLGTRGPRRMNCVMNSIPASSLEPGGSVPNQPDKLLPNPLDESFRSNISFSKSSLDYRSVDFSSSRFSELGVVAPCEEEQEETSFRPLVLKNKQPRWHEQLQCWCLNFRGRVTVASVKNFQLVAARQPPTQGAAAAAPSHPEQEKVILQFGKVGKDMFTMDYRYPLSAFQAFAICLSSFDTKLACE
uniref:Tubby-like F-box protein n=1 Tax=Brassica oleracea var. oleracea TaxID=109376 RepID=A0A0D3CD92_BRAOL